MKDQDRVNKVKRLLSKVKPFEVINTYEKVEKIAPISLIINGGYLKGFVVTCSGGWMGMFGADDIYEYLKRQRPEDYDCRITVCQGLCHVGLITQKDLHAYILKIEDEYVENDLKEELRILKARALNLGYKLVENKPAKAKPRNSGGYYSEPVKLAYD